MIITAFGLDIAGYSTGKSTLVRADVVNANTVSATLFRGHVYGEKIDGCRLLSPCTARETELVRACCEKAKLVVDIPIDLQDLIETKDPQFVWQLTKRPVDFVFDGLPPLADRLGSPVARFKNIMRSISETMLGLSIFETYPAASVELWKLDRHYKGGLAVFQNGSWSGDNDEKKNSHIAQIANHMRIVADEDYKIDDDVLDALICAVTGVLPTKWLLQEIGLEEEVETLLTKKLKKVGYRSMRNTVPRGYVLINALPKDLSIELSVKHLDTSEQIFEALQIV